MLIKTKRLFNVVMIALLMSVYFDINVVSALTPMFSPAKQDPNIFTFADLGVDSDIVMKGPYESVAIRFTLPPTWELQDGSEINLVVKSFFSTSSDPAQTTAVNATTSALLEVYFNRKLQQSIPLTTESGVATYRIPISVSDLGFPDADGYYSITLALDAAVDCDLDFHRTTAVIGINSYAVFPHVEKPLQLDLRKLPWPFYQERARLLGSTAVVIPPDPSADEVQAALVVMGTFGRMSQGRLPISMVTADQLTDADRTGSDLIFVGASAGLANFFNGLANPPITGSQFSIVEAGEEDGVLQVLPSPWNASKSLLLVSGTSDIGVVKAAQALSTGNLQTGITPDYSVVAQVNPFTKTGITGQDGLQFSSPDDITFSDLDYQVTTVDQLGSNYLTFEFVVPQGQIPSENPYVEIKFSNSTMVDTARSYISVFVNEIVVGSVELSDGSSSLVSAKIDIPASLLKYGLNVLDLEINLIPRDECSILAFSGLWATVYEDSYLHLPLTKSPESETILQDLKAYPYPFANDPSLGAMTFIVPSADPFAWSLAGKVAFDLGARVNGSILSFEAAFDNQIPDALRTGNLIVIGQPKNLAVLEEMRSTMPAYFEPESNIAILESQLIIYRVTDQKSLGYLEVFPSPWNPEAAVLGLFGTTPEGLQFALNSLLNFQIRETLSGNFSTYDGGRRAIIVDTRTGYGIGSFEASVGPDQVVVVTPSATDEAPGSPAPSSTGNSNLILLAIVGVILVMIVVVVFVVRLRKKKS